MALSAFASSIKKYAAKNPVSVDLHGCLDLGFRMADQAVREAWPRDPALFGMGTTLVAVVMRNFDFVVGNIGDSRAYLCSADTCRQLTIDHKDGPALTRAITGKGYSWDLFPKAGVNSLASGNGVLLSSDGLILGRAGITKNAKSYFTNEADSLLDVVEEIINEAYRSGSNDNISAMMITATEI